MLERQSPQQAPLLGRVEVARAVDLAVGRENASVEAAARQGFRGARRPHRHLMRSVAEEFAQIDVESVAAVAFGRRIRAIGGDGRDQLAAREDLDPQPTVRLPGSPGPAVDARRPLEPHLALDLRGGFLIHASRLCSAHALGSLSACKLDLARDGLL